MSIGNEILKFVKPLIETYTGGQPIRKVLLNAGIKRVTKLTPNLSKTVLHVRKNRPEFGKALLDLIMGSDELSKKFKAPFSEMCKIVNLKVKLLIDEKEAIAKELGEQDAHKEDIVSKMTDTQANEAVDEMIDKAEQVVSDLLKEEVK